MKIEADEWYADAYGNPVVVRANPKQDILTLPWLGGERLDLAGNPITEADLGRWIMRVGGDDPVKLTQYTLAYFKQPGHAMFIRRLTAREVKERGLEPVAAVPTVAQAMPMSEPAAPPTNQYAPNLYQRIADDFTPEPGATMNRDELEAMFSHATSGEFVPFAEFNKIGFVRFLLKPDEYRAERFNDVLTIYQSASTGEITGGIVYFPKCEVKP